MHTDYRRLDPNPRPQAMAPSTPLSRYRPAHVPHHPQKSTQSGKLGNLGEESLEMEWAGSSLFLSPYTYTVRVSK